MSEPKDKQEKTTTPPAATKSPAEMQAEIDRLRAELDAVRAGQPSPSTRGGVNLTARPAGVKMVKVRAKRDFVITGTPEETKMLEGRIVRGPAKTSDGKDIPGETIEVPEDLAKSLCRIVDGAYAFRGERFEDTPKHQIQLAERVA